MSGAVRRVVSRVARTGFRAIRKTPLGRVVEHPTVDRFRSRLLQMSANDLHEALGALEASGVPAWVCGGWGVDALLGEQTRRHGDVDLLIDEASDGERRACAALALVGYAPEEEQGEAGALLTVRTILRDRSGRTIELLFFRHDPVAPEGRLAAPYLSPDAFATGEVSGRQVPCLSVHEQLRLHSDYAPVEHDRVDVERLCRRFQLPPPIEYRTT